MKYILEIDFETKRHCLLCPVRDDDTDNCKMQYCKDFTNWEEQMENCPLKLDVTEKYHNPADITLLRKAKDCLKQGIKQLEKYINHFEQTPEEDACIEMHETVLEIDKILGGDG